tara:strand:+ start:1940 stop:2311 length:372 start_codon:yes stop_codon:yes gene_type:complete
MKTFTFETVIATEQDIDLQAAVDALYHALAETTEDCLVTSSHTKSKNYSEQGWKVARNRKFGISTEEAGDAHDSSEMDSSPEVAEDDTNIAAYDPEDYDAPEVVGLQNAEDDYGGEFHEWTRE